MLDKRIKINCSFNIIRGRLTTNGDQWRAWTVTLDMSNVDLKEHIDHVEYVLHASFGLPPIICKEPPYRLQREGWGEFDLIINIYMKDPLVPSPQRYSFDLNFKKSKYANYRKLILGSQADTEYKQQQNATNMIDLELEQDLQAGRARTSPRIRRPTLKRQESEEAAVASFSGKKSKKVFPRQGTTRSSSTSSFSPASSPSTTASPSPSPSSVPSLITPPADIQNKDLQHQHQHQQQQEHVVVQQDLTQDKQMQVCRSPHYILDPANDLNRVLDIEDIDLRELKAMLEALDDIHLKQALNIIKKYDRSKMNLRLTDDGAYYLMTLDTACSDLINELWEFVIDVEIEKCKESSTLSQHEQQQQNQH